MNNFTIISDSSCDLTIEQAKEAGIRIVPFQVTLDGQKYLRESVDIAVDDFYHRLRTENVFPKTSLPSNSDYAVVFREIMAAGNDVICICISSKFSGSYQSATGAKDIVLEEFPDRKITVIDSILCTGGQGLFVNEAAEMKRAGLPYETVVEKLEKIKHQAEIFTTVDSLKYLQKGGRIGKVAAIAGSLISIKPIITFNNGELHPTGKVRGKSKAIAELATLMNKAIGDKKEKYHICVMHGDELADITELKRKLEEEYGFTVTYPINYIGVTIGAHIGPTCLAIGYLLKHEYA